MALRLKWAAGKAARAGPAEESAYLNRYQPTSSAAAGPEINRVSVSINLDCVITASRKKRVTPRLTLESVTI
jgi:hypothetical protein